MKISEFIPAIQAEILCGGQSLDRSLTGGYAGDMLSWVMARLQAGQAWFTILNSMNVIAVASLTECACVVLTEQVEMDPEVLARAEDKEIVVLRTPLTTYEACSVLSALRKESAE